MGRSNSALTPTANVWPGPACCAPSAVRTSSSPFLGASSSSGLTPMAKLCPGPSWVGGAVGVASVAVWASKGCGSIARKRKIMGGNEERSNNR